MYKIVNTVQISFFDFNQDLGFQLSEDNEWVKLAQIIPQDYSLLNDARTKLEKMIDFSPKLIVCQSLVHTEESPEKIT